MKLMTVMKKTVDCVRLRSSKIAFKRKISQDFVTFLCSLLWNQLCSLLYTFKGIQNSVATGLCNLANAQFLSVTCQLLAL